MEDKFKIGLSLSGGGYRAAAYHLGTLKKLNQLGILKEVDVLSTISGGSIIGAYYCLQKDNFPEFEKSLYTKLQSVGVIGHVLFSFTFLFALLFIALFLVPMFWVLFTNYAWLSPIIFVVFMFLLLKLQFIIFPVSKRIERVFDTFFYDFKTMGDLPAKPALVVGTTNLNTSRLFTFSKDWMQDTTYQYLKDDTGEIVPVKFKAEIFPLSRAVIGSSCVPFAFTPITIDKKFFVNPERDFKRVYPQLVDGGVYDNQGIHKVMQTGKYACKFRIVSDAGNKLEDDRFRNTFTLLLRTVNVFMARIKNVQMVQGIYTENTIEKEIAYISLGWDIENCIPGFINNLRNRHVPKSVIEAHRLPDEWVHDPGRYQTEITTHLEKNVNYKQIISDWPDPAELKIARSVSTNLTRLKKAKVDALMKQASCMTELQVRLYCPGLVAQTT